MNLWREFRDEDISETVRAALRGGGAIGQMEQHPDEIAPFAALVAEEVRPARIIEIGTRRGGTCGLWCELASELVLGIDLPNERMGHERLAARYGAKFVSILADSQLDDTRQRVVDALTGLPADHGKCPWGDAALMVDLLFLDGNHTADAVRRDLELYAPLVRPGGIIAFHDIVDTNLTREVNCRVCEVWQGLTGDKREFNTDGAWGGIGVWRPPC